MMDPVASAAECAMVTNLSMIGNCAINGDSRTRYAGVSTEPAIRFPI